MYRLEIAFWSEHPVLQQLNSFLLSQTHQACLSHIKELVGGSVRELMLIINVNTYHSRKVHHRFRYDKDHDSDDNRGARNDEANILMISTTNNHDGINDKDKDKDTEDMSMRLSPIHYELFMKEEMQRLYHNDVMIGEAFIDTYFTSFITHTLPALCRLYPVHNRVLKLSIYFMKRHFQQQKTPLILYFRSYLDKKLHELCELSYKQYKKIYVDSNNNNSIIIATTRNSPSVSKTKPNPSSDEDGNRDDIRAKQLNSDDSHVTFFDQPYMIHEMHKVSNTNIRYINDDDMMMIVNKVRAIFAAYRFQVILTIDEQQLLVRSKNCDTHDYHRDNCQIEGSYNAREYGSNNYDDRVILDFDAYAAQFIEKCCQYHLSMNHALQQHHHLSDSISSRQDSSILTFRNHLSRLFKALLELITLLCSYRHSHQYMHAIDNIMKKCYHHQSHRFKNDDDSHSKASNTDDNDDDDRLETMSRSREIVRKYHFALLNLRNLLFCTFRTISDQLKSSSPLLTSHALLSSSSSAISRSTLLASSSSSFSSSSYQEFSGKVIIDIAKCCSFLLPYLLYADSILEYNNLILTSSTPIIIDIIITDSSTTAETDRSIDADSINRTHDINSTPQPSDILILLLDMQMMSIDSLVKLLTAVLRPKTSAYYESCKRLIGIDGGMMHHRVLVLVERVLYHYREKLELNIFDLLLSNNNHDYTHRRACDMGEIGQGKNFCHHKDDRDDRNDGVGDDNRDGSDNLKSKHFDSSRYLWYNDPSVQRTIRTKLSDGLSTLIMTSFTAYKPT